MRLRQWGRRLGRWVRRRAMSWLGLGKSAAKQRVLSPADAKEWERLEAELRGLLKATKALLADLKRYQDSLQALSKSQVRLASNLQSCLDAESSLQPDAAALLEAAEAKESGRSELVKSLRRTGTEPLKELLSFFAKEETELKRWEASLNDLAKVIARKPKPGREQEAKAQVDAARAEWERLDKRLRSDLRLLFVQRQSLVGPAFEALAGLHLLHWTEELQLEPSLSSAAPLGDEAYREEMREKLAHVHALSIVKPPSHHS